MKWLFNWIKGVLICCCCLYLASSCLMLGIPQMIIGIMQGAGQSVAGPQGSPASQGTSSRTSPQGMPTSMAMFDNAYDGANNINNGNINNGNMNNNAGNLQMAIPNFSKNKLV